jgi:hypothetical protein
MEWICAKCGKIDKNPRGKHYWIPIEFGKKIRGEANELSTSFGQNHRRVF